MQNRRWGRSALGAAALVILVAGCGSSSGTSSGAGSSGGSGGSGTTVASATSVGSIAAEVPAAIRSKGKLVVAEDATYPPNESIGPDGTTVVGMDADLAKALGTVLGLSVEVQNQGFDTIIPGLASGRFDLGMSSFTDNKEREKTVDFVTYFSAGTSFFVKANGGPTINTLDDLCGHKVAVEATTTQETDANAQDKKCTAAGKAGVTVLNPKKQTEANLDLQSDRADVAMADSPVAAFQVKQSNGLFKLTGQSYGTAPYGIAIPKGNGMAKAVLDAIKELMADGVYTQIMTTWGIQAGAISNPQINGATS